MQYTRTLELERKADIRNVLLDLSRASILIKQAEIARQSSLISQLEDQDLLLDLSNVHHFAAASLGQMDATLPSAMKLDHIRGKIWPGGAPPAAIAALSGGTAGGGGAVGGDPFTPSHSGRNGNRVMTSGRGPPLDADQLASISRPGRPPALDIRQRDAATYASYKSSIPGSTGTKLDPIDTQLLNGKNAYISSSGVPLTGSLSASSSASSGSSSSTSAASTPRSADFPVPPGSGRKSFDSPVVVGVRLPTNREYGEEMFSIPRKAVPKE